MPLEISFCPTFKALFEKTIASFSKSRKDVLESINSLKSNPTGNTYPGFKEHVVKKIRIALKENKLGKRKGLRCLYLYLRDKNKLIRLFIYKKGEFKREHQIKGQIKRVLPEILIELENGECNGSL